MVKLALVLLVGIFVALGIFLLIGNLQGDNSPDTDNSDVDSNTSQQVGPTAPQIVTGMPPVTAMTSPVT